MATCPSCGAHIGDAAVFCNTCGTKINQAPAPAPAPAPKPAPEPEPVSDDFYMEDQPRYYEPPRQDIYVNVNHNFSEYDLPPQYRPLGAWTYFGLGILYEIPIIGFIFLIVHAVSSSNINRRNYARSFFCVYLLLAIFAIIMIVLYLIFGASLFTLAYANLS